MELQNSFDNGSDGVGITPANSVTSGDAFDVATDVYYDNAQTFLGSASARIDASNEGQLGWTLSPTPRLMFFRGAFFLPAGFGAVAAEMETVTTTAGGSVGVRVEASGGNPPTLIMVTTSGPVPFVTVPPLGDWFRLEYAYQDGLLEARVALDPFGPHVEVENASSESGVDLNEWQVYSYVGDDVYVDQVGVSQVGWFGPYVSGGSGRRKIRRPRNPRRYQV